MKISKYSYEAQGQLIKRLIVTSNMYFDDPKIFCGQTFLHLIATRDTSVIAITLHDQNDHDYGFLYLPVPDKFFDVLHELINWMNDLEHGVCNTHKYLHNKDEFFPTFDCTRIFF